MSNVTTTTPKPVSTDLPAKLDSLPKLDLSNSSSFGAEEMREAGERATNIKPAETKFPVL